MSHTSTVDPRAPQGEIEALGRWDRFRPRDLRHYGIVWVFVALMVGLSLSSDAFLTGQNLANILDQNATIGIVACGATLVIVAGGFDLSAGALFAVASVIAAKFAISLGPVIGLGSGVLVGLLAGVINGIIVTRGQLTSFIATLATSIIFRGLAVVLAGGLVLSVSDESFGKLGSGEFLGITSPAWCFIIFALTCGFLLSRTTYGRYIYAVGGNSDAARLAGVRVGLTRGSTFAISGLAAGIAGVLAASQVSSADASVGVGLELAAIAAVVVGGTSIAGGEGAIWRTVVGVFTLALITNGFNLLGVPAEYQQIVQGLIILLAIGGDVWLRRERT